MKLSKLIFAAIFSFVSVQMFAQPYFFKAYEPFDENIPSPEEFLGYPIGSQHTRHDRIVAYLRVRAGRVDVEPSPLVSRVAGDDVVADRA